MCENGRRAHYFLSRSHCDSQRNASSTQKPEGKFQISHLRNRPSHHPRRLEADDATCSWSYAACFHTMGKILWGLDLAAPSCMYVVIWRNPNEIGVIWNPKDGHKVYGTHGSFWTFAVRLLLLGSSMSLCWMVVRHIRFHNPTDMFNSFCILFMSRNLSANAGRSFVNSSACSDVIAGVWFFSLQLHTPQHAGPVKRKQFLRIQLSSDPTQKGLLLEISCAISVICLATIFRDNLESCWPLLVNFIGFLAHKPNEQLVGEHNRVSCSYRVTYLRIRKQTAEMTARNVGQTTWEEGVGELVTYTICS